MGVYDGIYLYSDLDGTLLDDSVFPRQAARNLLLCGAGRTLRHCDERAPMIIGFVENNLPIRAPCIMLNGAALYDLEKKEYLAMHPVDPGKRCSCDLPRRGIVGGRLPADFQRHRYLRAKPEPAGRPANSPGTDSYKISYAYESRSPASS